MRQQLLSQGYRAWEVPAKEVNFRPPYDGAKDYFYITDVDDRDYLVRLIQATLPALPKPKVKKNPMKL